MSIELKSYERTERICLPQKGEFISFKNKALRRHGNWTIMEKLVTHKHTVIGRYVYHDAKKVNTDNHGNTRHAQNYWYWALRLPWRQNGEHENHEMRPNFLIAGVRYISWFLQHNDIE